MKLRSALLKAAILAAAGFALSGPAKADVTWLVNGTFDDGGTVVGHFTINVYGFLENNYNLLTTAGGTLPGFDYNPSDANITIATTTNSVDFQINYQQDLHLTFAGNLGVPASNNPIVGGSPGPSWECAFSYSCFVPEGGLTRYIGSGLATAVPELSTWAMMGLGFVGLGGLAFRRRAVRAPLAA
jgi:hypothetical protein